RTLLIKTGVFLSAAGTEYLLTTAALLIQENREGLRSHKYFAPTAPGFETIMVRLRLLRSIVNPERYLFIITDELKKHVLKIRQSNHPAPALVLFHDRRQGLSIGGKVQVRMVASDCSHTVGDRVERPVAHVPDFQRVARNLRQD